MVIYSGGGDLQTFAGYHIFFSADSLDLHDLEEKVDSDTTNKIDTCCFDNTGFLVFEAESEVEAVKKLTYLK